MGLAWCPQGEDFLKALGKGIIRKRYVMRFIVFMLVLGMLNTASLYALRATFNIEIDWSSFGTWALSFLLSFGWIQFFKVIGIPVLPPVKPNADEDDSDGGFSA
jgi:uncharacterized membrane protein